jgi:hypothetical protein
MNDDYLRKHHIQVSDWAWKTAQELFGMKSPSSRMSDLLDWALREAKERRDRRIKRGDWTDKDDLVRHDRSPDLDPDPGTIITATRETICQYKDKKTGDICGRMIGVGEKMVYSTGPDGRKKSECIKHRMDEE